MEYISMAIKQEERLIALRERKAPGDKFIQTSYRIYPPLLKLEFEAAIEVLRYEVEVDAVMEMMRRMVQEAKNLAPEEFYEIMARKTAEDREGKRKPGRRPSSQPQLVRESPENLHEDPPIIPTNS